jgi:hypothetical protein
MEAYFMNPVNNKFEFNKLLNWDYWSIGLRETMPVVDKASVFFWSHLSLIGCVILITIVLRFVKGFYLDKKTLQILENPQNAYMIENPIFQSLSHFQTYFTFGFMLLAFSFLSRQLSIALFSNRLFFGLVLIYLIYGAGHLLIYWFGKRKLDLAYYNQVIMVRDQKN